MTTPAQVLDLVERFVRNLDAYKRAECKKAHVRVEFIDPFFEAFGLGRTQRGRLHLNHEIHEAEVSGIRALSQTSWFRIASGRWRLF